MCVCCVCARACARVGAAAQTDTQKHSRRPRPRRAPPNAPETPFPPPARMWLLRFAAWGGCSVLRLGDVSTCGNAGDSVLWAVCGAQSQLQFYASAFKGWSAYSGRAAFKPSFRPCRALVSLQPHAQHPAFPTGITSAPWQLRAWSRVASPQDRCPVLLPFHPSDQLFSEALRLRNTGFTAPGPPLPPLQGSHSERPCRRFGQFRLKATPPPEFTPVSAPA